MSKVKLRGLGIAGVAADKLGTLIREEIRKK